MIAQRLGAGWAADFRDLWLTSPHRRERLRLHRRIGEHLLARRLLPKADLVLAVDPVVAAEARQLGAKSAHVLAHFTAGDPPVAAPMPDGLNVVHAGSIALSDPDADIRDLLAPFEVAIATNVALRLILVGRLLDREREAILRSPAAASIDMCGIKPLDEALSIMAGADALAFVASEKMHVPPSKIVDYLQFDRPIIACGAGPWRADPRVPQGDPAQALSRLRRGDGRNTAAAPPTAREAARQLLDLMK
jgi:hypothetical protein